jgi:hypothetical protein
MSGVLARIVTSFDDPAVRPEVWSALLATGDTDVARLGGLYPRPLAEDAVRSKATSSSPRETQR